MPTVPLGVPTPQSRPLPQGRAQQLSPGESFRAGLLRSPGLRAPASTPNGPTPRTLGRAASGPSSAFRPISKRT